MYYSLRGITAINFDAGVEKTDGRCAVDWQSLKTALLFVANQSVKLKIIPEFEHHTRSNELFDEADRIFKEDMDKATGVDKWNLPWKDSKYIAAKKEASDYSWMPHLFIYISPIELASGCAAWVEAKLGAYLDNMNHTYEILPTHSRAAVPYTVDIWSKAYMISGPKDGFAIQATRVAEDLMRELVNDWSAAKDLPPLYGEP